MHFICAVLFVVFLFIHCNFRLSSWDYFIATVIVYGISFVARTYKAFIHNGFGFHAELDSLPNNMIKVTIPLPANKSRIHWKPGQHFFIRFLKGGVHQITNHPFTVASVDTSAYPEAWALLAAKDKDKGEKASKQGREITCYIRLKSGTTGRMGRLIASSQTKSGVGVLLDGPYGGMQGSLKVYDRALLIAGGSGE
jgi:predicted ferric reductase